MTSHCCQMATGIKLSEIANLHKILISWYIRVEY